MSFFKPAASVLVQKKNSQFWVILGVFLGFPVRDIVLGFLGFLGFSKYIEKTQKLARFIPGGLGKREKVQSTEN